MTLGYEIKLGDCLTSLKTMVDQSVNCCVTSPPYFGLRDYGTGEWEGGDASCDHGIRRWEGRKQTQGAQSGHASAADRLARTECPCGAARVDKQIGLEPTPAEFVDALVRVLREVRRVLKDDGSLWLNLGDSYANDGKWGGSSGGKHPKGLHGDTGVGRGKTSTGLREKNLIGVPWRVALALQEDGWYLRQDIIWQKPNVMPESVKDRCTKSHEYIFLLTKSPKYYFDHEAIKEDAVDGKRSKRTVWTVPTVPFKAAHFATFPPALIEPCILAGCPVGGVVLDPFGGSGTTAGVAVAHGRKAVLCELNPEYAALVPSRVEAIVRSVHGDLV